MAFAAWKNNYTNRKSFTCLHHTTGWAGDASSQYMAVCDDGLGGYDFKVNNVGALRKGEECVGQPGEHCSVDFGPYCNANSVGIAMSGCFGGCGSSDSWPTAAQEAKVGWVHANLCMVYSPLLKDMFRPHRMYKQTQCCGDWLCNESLAHNKWNSAGMSMIARIWKHSDGTSVTC